MYTFTSTLSETEFTHFSQQHPQHTLLQTYPWAKIKSNFTPYYTGVYQDGTLVGCALVLIRHLGLKQSMMYIPKGPLLDYHNTELLTFYTQQLKQFAKSCHCLFIRIDPNIPYRLALLSQFKETAPTTTGLQTIQQLLKAGWKHRGLPLDMSDSFQPRFTAVTHLNELDLTKLSTRYKKAMKRIAKRNVHVYKGSDNYLDELEHMIQLTEKRQQVSLRDKDYFKTILEAYPGHAFIYIAKANPQQEYHAYLKEKTEKQEEYELIKEKSPKKAFKLQEQITSLESLIHELEPVKDQPEITIGALLAVYTGNTIELLYAGTDIQYDFFYPQEAIYNYILLEAIDKGIELYSMGGIDGSLNDGLINFKSLFNPHIHELIGEFDLPISPLYPAFLLAWKARKIVKRFGH